MGLLNKPKEDKNDSKTKGKIKKKVVAVAVTIAIKLIPLLIVVAMITSFVEWVIKVFQPQNTVNEIYEKLEIEDVCDLIEIKGNSNDGYYLDFTDDVDEKLDDTIDYLNRTAGVKSSTDKEFLKKMIKAEVCAQFPDLGANVDNGNGFQGIIDILRIMPNKKIGELKNTGAGQETIKDDDDLNKIDINNQDVINKQEKIVKKWSKGKELTLAAKAFVYSQEDSTLHPGQKIDYWTPQKNEKTQNNLEIRKNAIVTYTGEYSISVNKMTNEGLIYVGIEKDDIKGYIKYNFIVKDSEDENITDEELVDTGYSETTEEKVTDTIDSNVYKLTYIPKEEFDKNIENANKDVLYHFTIDDNGNLITAKCSLLADGTLELTNNSAINLKSALQNYIIPYAYLMYFYIEADYKDFSSDLADKVFDSKIIIALEDNVTTTKVVETIETKKVSENSSYSYDWTPGTPTETLTEYCSTKIEIIYADTWCAKLVDKSMYKSDLLNVSVGQPKNINMPGTVTDTTTHQISEEREAGTGTDTEYYYKYDDDGNIIDVSSESFSYTMYERTITDTHSIANSYSNGDKDIIPKENVFVDLYKRHKMYNRMNEKRFLDILEKDERTANLSNLTKYLIYLATGVSYDGVKEYDFSEYANNAFSETYNIYGNTFEEKVWFALIGEGFSEYSVAGAMGNFKQESGFKANNLQGSYEKILGMTDETYTECVNNGTYTNFVHDSAGYGLAQWTFWTRKEAFLNYTKEKGVGIDNEEAQIEFLIKEINQRGCPKWKAATSVEDACYNFEKEFEQAGNPQMGNRLTYAEEIYNKYHGQTAPIDVEVNLSDDSKIKMQALLKEAQRIANDDRYTYSKENRDGEFQYDCSSFVARLYYKFFGISVPATTGVYGASYRVGPTSSVTLQPGDVLWRSGHVTLYIGNGKYAAAHGRYGIYANNPAAQISVYNDSPSKYTYVYRFINN